LIKQAWKFYKKAGIALEGALTGCLTLLIKQAWKFYKKAGIALEGALTLAP
jgi:hypothetical protein